MTERNNQPLWGIRTSGLSMEWVLTSEGLHIQWRNQQAEPLATVVDIDEVRIKPAHAA